MRRNNGLAKDLPFVSNDSLRLRELRTNLLGQLEQNRHGRSYGRSYGYARVDLVQSDLTRFRPQFRTLVQLRGSRCAPELGQALIVRVTLETGQATFLYS